jgi:RNA polymerase sigma-70 factor (ECF subfamily)
MFWRAARSGRMHGKGLRLPDIAAAALDRVNRNDVKAPADLPEVTLADRAQRGDRDAWGQLIERHDHRVVLSLVARGIRLDRARELAHQAWIRLIDQQRAGRLERIELPGLAIRQASFLALDAARRRGPVIERLDHGEPATDPEATIEERLIRREELQRAQAELERCAPAARELFALIYGDPGMRHADAARQLGLSVQRVRQTLCEVRARLRAAIDAEPADD